MRRPHQGEAELIREVYENLLGEDLWPRVLARLTGEFKSTYSAVLRRNRVTESVHVTATDVLSRERQQSYEAHYARLTPKSFFFAKAAPAVTVFTDRLYGDYDAYLRSELYNDFFRPLKADHLMFVELRRDATEQESLVVRRGRDVGFYEEKAVRRLERLCGHLGNGARLRAKLTASEHQAKNYAGLLDSLGVTAFVTDRTGAIHHVTEAAERLLQSGGVFTARAGRLGARPDELQARLRTAIADCVDSVDDPVGHPWRIVRVASSVGDTSSPTVLVSAMVWMDPSGLSTPVSLVVVNERRRDRMEPVLEAARQLGLTPAESRLVVALCDGRSLSDYASSAGISVLTARTLLKHAREKTQTHSQTELVALLLGSVR